MTQDPNIQVAFRDQLGRLDLNVAFEAPAQGVTALFGPSGCGKTTVLRCVAGLHRAKYGRCVIGDQVWQSEGFFRPVHKRPIGYVFQEASLFPHLSVKKNLLFGEKHVEKERSRQFSEVVELLGIEKLLERSPRNLSGGEHQRVAIGRALLSDPELLLMDEPLSALDQLTKEEIMPFIERLQAALRLPIFYVSHDINEVDRLADYLVFIEAGKAIAAGPLSKLQSDPSLPLVAAANAAVSLDAMVVGYEPEFKIAKFKVNGALLNVPSEPVEIEDRRRIKICADDVSLSRETSSKSTIDNHIPAKILDVKDGEPFEVTAILGLGPNGGGDRILARITKRSWVTLGLDVGENVHAQVKAVALMRRGI
jgi:molybdate transport system ATP-binding protein